MRIALLDFQNEWRMFLKQASILMEMDAYGIKCEKYYTKEYDPSAGKDWEIKMDILEETIEKVIEEEKSKKQC